METLVKCNHCGYVWITKSLKIFVSCPSCLNKVKRADNIMRSPAPEGNDEAGTQTQ